MGIRADVESAITAITVILVLILLSGHGWSAGGLCGASRSPSSGCVRLRRQQEAGFCDPAQDEAG